MIAIEPTSSAQENSWVSILQSAEFPIVATDNRLVDTHSCCRRRIGERIHSTAMKDNRKPSTITLQRTQAKNTSLIPSKMGIKSAISLVKTAQSSLNTRLIFISSFLRSNTLDPPYPICVPPPPSQPVPSALPLSSNIVRLPLSPALSESLLASSSPPAPLWQALLLLPELPLAPSATSLPESPRSLLTSALPLLLVFKSTLSLSLTVSNIDSFHTNLVEMPSSDFVISPGLLVENMPAPCMNLATVITGDYNAGNPIPMSSSSILFRGLTQDQLQQIQDTLDGQ
jgi:hypothetical protein